VLLVGESWTGKTCILSRINKNEFELNSFGTLGAAYVIKSFEDINGHNITAEIWDICGRRAYWHLAEKSARGAIGVVVVYDIANRESFDNTLYWLNQARTVADSSAVYLLVGNKSDVDDSLLREVSFQEGMAMAEKLGVSSFVETSALDGTGIKEAFDGLLSAIVKQRYEPAVLCESFEYLSRESTLSGAYGREFDRESRIQPAPVLHRKKIRTSFIHKLFSGSEVRNIKKAVEDRILPTTMQSVWNTSTDPLPVKLSGISGTYATVVNGVYIPTRSKRSGQPVYRKVQTKDLETKNVIVDMLICFHCPYGQTDSSAWVVQSAVGKEFARLILPDGTLSCSLDQSQVDWNGKRLPGLYWEMRSSLDMLGFRVRPGGLIRAVDPPNEGSKTGATTCQQDESQKKILNPSPQSSDDTHPSYLRRVVVVGPTMAGKTSLVMRFSKNCFVGDYLDTVGVDVVFATACLPNNQEIKCQLWDTSGNDIHWPLVNVYLRYPCRGVTGVLLVYDISSRKSFDQIDTWMARVADMSSAMPHVYHLIGNKVRYYAYHSSVEVEHAATRESNCDSYNCFFLFSLSVVRNTE